MEQSGVAHTPNGVIEQSKKDAWFDTVLSIGERGVKLLGLHQRGFRNAHTIVQRHLEVRIENLPAEFRGYKILHLTDLHVDAPSGIADVISNSISDLEPDLCVMTGDYRSGHEGSVQHVTSLVSRLLGSISPRDGVFFTLGNHDCHSLGLSIEKETGAHLLNNERVEIRRGGQSITLTGADDVNHYYSRDATQCLIEKVDGVGIALVHSPEMAAEAAQGGHSLYLCGHTHGGQIALPGGKPLVTHLNRNRELAKGLWSVGSMIGYTSPGAGVSGLPLRYFTRGEVTLISLENT